jgi:hypothetical protein
VGGAVLVLPPELRMYSDMSKVGGRGPGMDAYPDRGAWLAARRAWEASNGMTAGEWFGELLSQMRASGCTLDEMNLAFSEFLTEADDWKDSRLIAV